MRTHSIAARRRLCSLAALLALSIVTDAAAEPLWAGFVASPWFDEQARLMRLEPGARAIVVAPLAFDPARPTRLLLFATPNGNTAEQTLGCAAAEGLDWHFDIQHVAAQARRLRTLDGDENLVLACVQPDHLSWPAWRRERDGGSALIHSFVAQIRDLVPDGDVTLELSAHSGGGSFLFGYINGVEAIPADVRRIVFLDANYSYDEADGHGDKLQAWLEGAPDRHLVFLAYDDREITFQGKKVVGPTGGTWRASHRMFARFDEGQLEVDTLGDFSRHAALGGRWLTLLHPNPENIILHTRLVGEMNGLLYGHTVGTPHESDWGALGAPRAYTDWVQPVPYGAQHLVP